MDYQCGVSPFARGELDPARITFSRAVGTQTVSVGGSNKVLGILPKVQHALRIFLERARRNYAPTPIDDVEIPVRPALDEKPCTF